MQKITVWGVSDDTGWVVKHNHIENGWVEGDKPQPIKKEYTNQLGWQKLEWLREYAYLIDGKVVYLHEVNKTFIL